MQEKLVAASPGHHPKPRSLQINNPCHLIPVHVTAGATSTHLTPHSSKQVYRLQNQAPCEIKTQNKIQLQTGTRIKKKKRKRKRRKVISNPTLAGCSQIIHVENCPNFSSQTAFVSDFQLSSVPNFSSFLQSFYL